MFRTIKPILQLSLWLFLAFTLGAGLVYARAVTKPAIGGKSVSLTITEGDGPRSIASKLKELNLLDNERPFFIYVLLVGKRNAFIPGDFELPGNSSIKQLVNVLTGSKKQQITITTIEGWRINDIAKLVNEKTKISEADFKASATVDPYEGYLFPDTYYFKPDATAKTIVATMRANFDHRTKDLGLNQVDVTLASIIEREAKTDEDRAMIAGVYINRLKADMPLEADPTVQYAKGSWAPITLGDYKSVVSPYNTYLNKGLPPTPISNPGLASLKAAKNPAKHDYYYFFHTKDGKTIYSKTIDEHNTNKKKYLK